MKQYAYALSNVPDEMLTPEICMMAVQQDGNMLKLIPEKKRTQEIYIAAVSQNGNALKYIPKNMRTQNICTAAVQQNGNALEYVPRDCQTLEIYKTAIKTCGRYITYLNESAIEQEDVHNAVNENPDVIKKISTKFITEEIICLYLNSIKEYGWRERKVIEKLLCNVDLSKKACLTIIRKFINKELLIKYGFEEKTKEIFGDEREIKEEKILGLLEERNGLIEEPKIGPAVKE